MTALYGVEQMYAEAERFAHTLTPRSTGATVVALSGGLGSGKTTFTQGVARALGISESITSPTFVIEKVYPLPKDESGRLPAGRQGFARLIHIDTYRVKGEKELQTINWQEIIADPSNLILLEWPEQIQNAIPEHAIKIIFSGAGDWRDVRITAANAKE